MTGSQTEGAARLKVNNPYMLGIHSVVHRLVLAASQSANTVPYIKNTTRH